jgi:hypothetical protein
MALAAVICIGIIGIGIVSFVARAPSLVMASMIVAVIADGIAARAVATTEW